MANHRAAALLIASLLVAVAVADARLVAKHHNARLTIPRGARAGRQRPQHTLITAMLMSFVQ